MRRAAPLSIAWAAAPPQQTPQSEAPEKPSTAQETPKPRGARTEDAEARRDSEGEAREDRPGRDGGSPGRLRARRAEPVPPRRSRGADPQAEIVQLFLKVDKRLNRVTELLFEASAGDMSSAGEIGSAGIDELIREAESQAGGARSDIAKLLEASRSQSEAASGEIGRILEIAQQQSSSGGSSGQQQGQPSCRARVIRSRASRLGSRRS